MVYSEEKVALAEFVEEGLFLLSVFCSRVLYISLSKYNCVVHHTEEAIDRGSFKFGCAAAVIERIFLTALGSFRMWRAMDHRWGVLGVTVYWTVHSTVTWSLHLDVDPVIFIAVVSD